MQSALSTAPELTSALPHTSPPTTTVALLGPIISPNGDFEAAVPFDDRPWEMFEKMGPASRAPSHGYLFLASKPLADTASIPMALFGPRLKRDALPDDPSADLPGGDRMDEYTCFASERNLGDGLTGEPIGARQAATGLFDGSDEYAAHESAVAPPPVSPASAKTAPSVPAASSTGTTTARLRRMSNRLASGATKPSGGAADPITIDIDDDDDEGANDSDSSSSSDEEALGARSAKRRRTASKTSATRPTAAGKRPATSGKAPARATTGGKNVGRKSTASKTRRPAGKAPMKGGKRKPSNA